MRRPSTTRTAGTGLPHVEVLPHSLSQIYFSFTQKQINQSHSNRNVGNVGGKFDPERFISGITG
jgi:hypothetical protein